MIKKIITITILAVFGIMLLYGAALAKVSAEVAERLNKDLTPMGAERAGNKEGTIPAWTGGLAGVPKGIAYAGPGTPYPDPYKNDKVLFSITGKNVNQYADKLSGMIVAMLKKYPGMRLDVYPTHRSAAAPAWIYKNAFSNATRCELTPDGLAVLPNGGWGAIPFPIPQKAEEVIFNHLLYWLGMGYESDLRTFNVLPNGHRAEDGGAYAIAKYPWYIENEASSGIFYKLFVQYKTPERRKGEVLLVIDPLNQVKDPRRAWQYLPGQRRVRRAPTIAYDTPNPSSNGLSAYDDVQVFNGALDRFNWKLLGKKELYIPYNNFAWEVAPLDKLLTVRYPNPDYLRWELHRVWVVEATLKPGKRHVYSKRIIYLDEDTWAAKMSDSYDGQGKLWRMTLQTTLPAYDVPSVISPVYLHFDITREDYHVCGLQNEMPKRTRYDIIKDDAFFTPENVRRWGLR